MNDTTRREAMSARIRALMAKTVENGCTEAEARAAAEAVDRLLEMYELTLDEVSIQDQEVMQIAIAGMARHSVRFSAMAIAHFADCRVWEENGAVSYLGLDVDTQIAEYLTLVFRRALDREIANFTMFNADYALHDSIGQNVMVQSFGIGMASRLGERLGELKSKRDFAVKASGRDLVVAKAPLLDEALAVLGIVIGEAENNHSIRNGKAFLAGRNAAESIAISQGVGGGQGGRRIR